MLFEQAKRDNNDVQDSMTEFFMYDCECPKSSNGYYCLNCVALKCKVCKKASPMPLKCWNSELKHIFINLKQQKNLTRKSTRMGQPQENIRKDRESWAYTDFWRDIQQIAVPQENVYKP